MWEVSLPDVGLNKSVRHEPKQTIPSNWGLIQETLPHCVVVVHMCLGLKLMRHMWEAPLPDVGLNKSGRHEPKRIIPANWGLRQETLPQLQFMLQFDEEAIA